MTQLQNTASSKDVSVVTNIVPEAQLRKAQLRALKIFADAVSCTYGPMGGYTAYSLGDTNQKAKGIVSNYTKDGFTVLKHVDVDKPIEYLLKTEIRDICTRVIKVIGDGTTSATMLSTRWHTTAFNCALVMRGAWVPASLPFSSGPTSSTS